MDNTRPCECCGQIRPYPTQPGKWRYKTMTGKWWTVTVAKDEEGLTITPEGGAEPIWWPNNAQWEKIED